MAEASASSSAKNFAFSSSSSRVSWPLFEVLAVRTKSAKHSKKKLRTRRVYKMDIKKQNIDDMTKLKM